VKIAKNRKKYIGLLCFSLDLRMTSTFGPFSEIFWQ